MTGAELRGDGVENVGAELRSTGRIGALRSTGLLRFGLLRDSSFGRPVLGALGTGAGLWICGEFSGVKLLWLRAGPPR